MFRLQKSNSDRTNSVKTLRPRRSLLIEGLEQRRLMATFQVLNNNDDGAGSLRAAIVSSNTNAGKDTIEFAIAGADKKINLQTGLPFVTDPVVIDATTQPGFVDRPLVEVDGAAMSGNVSGLFIPAGDSTVRGLSITNFANGIFLANLGGNKLESNYVGLSLNGDAAGNRANGIILQDSPGNTIGGSTAIQRNVISSNAEFGVRVQGIGASNNLIQGNYIGTDISGTSARPNLLDGVLVANATGAVIGTDGNGVGDAGEGNLLSGNGERGIRLFTASNNVIAGNFIGVTVSGTLPLPNRYKGLTIDGGSNNNRIGTNTDGTSDAIEKNVVSGNSSGGIELFGSSSNLIAGNYVGTSADGLQLISNNGNGIAISLNTSIQNDLSRNLLVADQFLAIDLGNDGLTSNDANDADVGPNQLQNFPTLVSASISTSTTGSKVQIAGGLESAPNSTYRIEYFAKTGAGIAIDSMEYLGSGFVLTDSTGQVNWIAELNTSPTLQSILATATNTLTGTSEFSPAISIKSQLPLTIAVPSARENVGSVQATVSRGTLPIGTALTVALSSGTPSLVQVPNTVEIPAGQTSATFAITVVNDTVWKINQATLITASVGSLASGSASITITDDDSPWHNFDNAVDVTGDGKLSPIDALKVINVINSGRGRSIFELPQPTDGSKLFADVNNDEVISPIDALLVINALNSRANAEGEAAQSSAASVSQPIESMFDLALQDLDLVKRRR